MKATKKFGYIIFLICLASGATIDLHANVLGGVNGRRKTGGLFGALARAVASAACIDERVLERVPSTKEMIKRWQDI